jgi:hypothetical protein
MSRRAYNRWYGMIRRCHDPKHVGYKYYGARGISVCDRWQRGEADKTGVECFYGDMGPCPDKLTLDRIDNDRDEPSNSRWATQEEQVRNRRKRNPATLQPPSRSFQMRVTTAEWWPYLDDWRRLQPDMPTRAGPSGGWW